MKEKKKREREKWKKDEKNTMDLLSTLGDNCQGQKRGVKDDFHSSLCSSWFWYCISFDYYELICHGTWV